MQILSVEAFKSNFFEVLQKVIAGEGIGISAGKKKELVAKLVPAASKKIKRKIGVLEGKSKVTFSRDFKITEKEFLGL